MSQDLKKHLLKIIKKQYCVLHGIKICSYLCGFIINNKNLKEMKKVISVNLGSKVFQIEEDAYTYLNNILSKQWKKQELEVQVAERLAQKLNGVKTVITYPDVVDALYQLGFSASDSQSNNMGGIREKRLYRRQRDKMIAGVCSGLGEYFEIDPVIARVLFVLSLFMATMGFWLYIILWIIIPNSNNESKL
jgi:phage shock protein C